MTPELKLVDVSINYARLKKAADRATDKSTVKGLSFIRRRAQTKELRRRKKTSEPGKPPSVHSKSSYATLKNIQFEYLGAGAGMVGAVKANMANFTTRGRQTVPNIMEKGGRMMIPEERRLVPKGKPYRIGAGRGPNGRMRKGRKAISDGTTWTEWKRRDLRSRRSKKDRQYRQRIVTIAARPFMKPALEFEVKAGNVIGAWKDSFY